MKDYECLKSGKLAKDEVENSLASMQSSHGSSWTCSTL